MGEYKRGIPASRSFSTANPCQRVEASDGYSARSERFSFMGDEV